MSRRFARLVPVLVLLLIGVGCQYDYLFVAFEIECPLDDDGNPTRCYPAGEWNTLRCTRYESSPFEILSGPYQLEIDIDIPETAPGNRFPRKLQVELMGYDADMEEVFQLRQRQWRINRRTGRVEEILLIEEDLIVPAGGELCINIRTRGPELRHGWLAGLLMEPVVEELTAPAPSSP